MNFVFSSLFFDTLHQFSISPLHSLHNLPRPAPIFLTFFLLTTPPSLNSLHLNETVPGGSPIVSFPLRPNVDVSNSIATNNIPSHSEGLNTGVAATIGIVVSLIVLCLLGIAVCFVQKNKKGKRSRSDYTTPSPFISSHNLGALFFFQILPLLNMHHMTQTFIIKNLQRRQPI